MTHVAPKRFTHTVIDPAPAGKDNDILLIADVNGDGHNDIIVGGKYGLGEGQPEADGNLVWYEAPRWTRHVIGCGELEAGGVVVDLTGNGRLDIVAGQQWNGHELYWWENPADPTQRWTRRLITDRYQKYHDQAVGDVDGDGKDELVILSQKVRQVIYADIPDDPRVEPWPEANFHVIHDDVEVEGARIVDIDGDGVNEIVAGANLFKPGPDPTQPWSRRVLIEEFAQARVAIADLNGNGHLDIVLAEGESHPARLVWLEGPDFETVHVLHDDLCHPHSLEIADFHNRGASDIFCGEMNLGKTDQPRLLLLLNDGTGNFTEQVIPCPQGTHEAKVGMLSGSPYPSIAGKPYHPHNQVDLWQIVD